MLQERWGVGVLVGRVGHDAAVDTAVVRNDIKARLIEENNIVEIKNADVIKKCRCFSLFHFRNARPF